MDFPLQAEGMWVDYGTGDHCHIFKLNSINTDDEKKLALLGLHASTGNDYVSSFFRRKKEKSWKIIEKYSRFTTMFANLGNSWETSEEDLKCHLCRGKGKSVDELRYKKFENVYRTKNKIQDLSLFPTCRRSLVLHLKQANYIARIWKLCFQAIINFQDISNHGWNINGAIHLTTEEFPDYIIDILTNEDDSETVAIEGPDDSDDEDDG